MNCPSSEVYKPYYLLTIGEEGIFLKSRLIIAQYKLKMIVHSKSLVEQS